MNSNTVNSNTVNSNTPHHCAPCWNKDNCGNEKTCFSKNETTIIKEQLGNKYRKILQNCDEHPDKCILQNMEMLGNEALFNQLRLKLKTPYPSEWKQKEDTWLNTINIDEVLSRYEKPGSHFYLLGVSPKNWDTQIFGDMCITERMCKLNLHELYTNDIRYIGAVFNLDSHNQGGSHWNGLFADLTKGGIYFSDSYGTHPNESTVKLMNKIEEQGNELILSGVIKYSDLDTIHHDTFTVISVIDEYSVEVNVNDTQLVRYTPTLLNSDSSKIYTIHNINGNIIRFNEKLQIHDIETITQFGFRKYYNNIRQQHGGSECGVYSIYFITQLLFGVPFSEFIKIPISDEEMIKQRKIFFDFK